MKRLISLCTIVLAAGTASAQQSGFPKLDPEADAFVHLEALRDETKKLEELAGSIKGCEALIRKMLLKDELTAPDFQQCNTSEAELEGKLEKALARLETHLARLKETYDRIEVLNNGEAFEPEPEPPENHLRLVSVISEPETGDTCSADTALNQTIIQCFSDNSATPNTLRTELQSSCNIAAFTHKLACGHAEGTGGTITVNYKCDDEADARTHTVPVGTLFHISCGTDLFKAPE
ncbi:MAG: hypothetical protein AAFY09_13495 [Pseudomonadota bacterium]